MPTRESTSRIRARVEASDDLSDSDVPLIHDNKAQDADRTIAVAVRSRDRPLLRKGRVDGGAAPRQVVVMGRFRRGRDGAAGLVVVEHFRFPEEAVARFQREHPEVHPEDSALVEAATRQWFRLLVPEPAAALALPSRAISDYWLALLYAEAPYRQFCQDAFGGFVPHRPPPTGPGEDVADAPGLLRTLRLAARDEPNAPNGLPWVFRLDTSVKILNARRYLRDCGGGPECYPVAGVVCLRHLSGVETSLRRTYDPRKDKPAVRTDHGSVGTG